MWNYMGWDNASTVAGEVENPQRNYPRAMIVSTIVVATTYILPLAAMALAGMSTASFSTGDWTTAARSLGGPLLGLAVAAAGCITGIGMFNALAMSYARLPFAMAADGLLPRVFERRNRRGVPWASLLACSAAWALALKIPFERLISFDLILYGTSLLLEFIALVVLRIREPQLPRPFRAGNLAVACLLCIGPAALIVYALYAARDEQIQIWVSTSALLFASFVALLGPVFYFLTSALRRPRESTAIPAVDGP
jgi:amino acid transporter